MRGVRKLFGRMRGLRAFVAVCLMTALVAVFFLDLRAREDLRIATLETAMGMNWRLNDVIVETLSLKNDVDRFVLGATLPEEERLGHLKALQLRYEILWSNAEIALETDLKNYPRFGNNLQALLAHLAESEDLIYAEELPDPWELSVFGREIAAYGAAIQKAWQDTRYFSVQMFIGREETRFAEMQAILRERVVLFLILLSTVYLLFETYLAGKARRKQEQLKAEAQAAALASEAKSVFLANVSHEIRTPLNGILGMASELEETDLDADQRGCLNVIVHAGDVLLHTLNDVLDLSKVEAGRLDLERTEFDLHELLDAAIGLYRARAEEKRLRLTLARADHVPRHVIGDGQRISQVLHNLIGNAIKFTESGSVTLRAGPGEAPGHIAFAVEDTGSGIDPSVHAKIFEPFSQADSSITRTKGGTGLGLSIARGLCEAMGGHLALESRLGDGATFRFDLPLPEAEERAQDETFLAAAACDGGTALPDGGSARILLVDDNETNRLLLRRFLRDQDVVLMEAGDGAAAVAAAEAHRFDAVLMDVQMPVLDGIGATRQIRDREAALGLKPMRIIAVTANVMTHQIEAYLASGFDDVLCKPVSKAAVLSMLGLTRKSAA